MPKYRIHSISAIPGNDDLTCDTGVLDDADREIGRIAVQLSASDVLSLAALPKAERISAYKALFAADPRIQSTLDSDQAAAQIEADVTLPITVTL